MLFTLPLDRQGEFKELVRLLGLGVIFTDPREPARIRKLMNKGFGPAAAEALRPKVEKIGERVL